MNRSSYSASGLLAVATFLLTVLLIFSGGLVTNSMPAVYFSLALAGAGLFLLARPSPTVVLPFVPLTVPLGVAVSVPISGASVIVTYSEIAVALTASVSLGRPVHHLKDIRPWAALVIVTSLVSTLFADDFGLSAAAFKTIALSVIIVLCARTIPPRERARATGLVGLACGALATITSFMIVAQAGAAGLGGDADLAKSATDLSFGRSNYLASLIVLGIIGCAATIPFSPSSRAWLTRGGLIVAGLPGLFLTGSRSQLLALACTLVLAPWLLSAGSPARKMRVAMPTLALSAVVAFVAWEQFLRAWLPAWEQGILRFSTVNTRQEIWAATFEQFVTHPIFGVGLQNTSLPNGEYWMAHNFVLQVLAEVGIVGALALSGFLLTVFRQTTDSRRTALGLVLLLVAIAGAAEPTLRTRDYDYVFWVIVSVLALSGINRHDEKRAGGINEAQTASRE